MLRHVGRYELGELIGTGGMGQVWAGRDPELGRHVAIKLIQPREGSTSSEAGVRIARFRREAQIMAQLAHPGVPQIYDIVPDPAGGERLYIVMQRLYGSSLKDICGAFGRLPLSWTACLGVHLCSVLTHTGSVPLVHRDLKPANIMVTDGGLAMVLDFGIAALLDGDNTTLTPTGRPVGTPRYMSPEQALAGEVTPRSDLYALGCVLYELITGQPPFTQDNVPSLLYHHVHEPAVPVRERRPEAGRELDRLVRDLLAKRPEDRPASAQEVIGRLVPFLPRQGNPSVDAKAAEGWPQGLSPLVHPGPAWFTAPSAGGVIPALDADRLREADALFEQKEYARALALYQKRVSELAAQGAEGGPEGLKLRGQIAYCLMKLGEVVEALEAFETLLKAAGETFSPTDPFLLTTRRRHGMLLHSAGRLSEAFHVLVALYPDLLRTVGAESPETNRVRAALNRLRRQLRPGK
ncbi:serine/threonine-protein kinase [Streptomyces sp. DSM 40750]|uniref:serine/threonine-protein kinase n=1 Tax=Streptomyces sp. DSM 40750 TaxID=2801030 RepID=UPI00214B80B8|nr:serine/threonine-protein kinase [Streptomyces sp. DSM 40750]UUU18884.1 protein kinase [Streptomyces sp. DSM 40750]UUU27774.1 protein kinase [Streptomyces sp. DSM 40750]